MIWSAANLRDLDIICVRPSEVVYAFLSLTGEPSAIDEALLDDDEQVRSRGFVRAQDRRRFVMAHVALRLFLGRCLGVEHSSVRYERGINGKPHLMPGLPSLEFNLSHSAGLGLIAVARDRSVGVDVEHVRDIPDAPNIADAFFSVEEQRNLRSVSSHERPGAFFRSWTCREALIKATGEGLGGLSDELDASHAGDSSSSPTRNGDPCGATSGWLSRDLPSPPGYAAAGAVAMQGDTHPRWRELSFDDPGVSRTNR